MSANPRISVIIPTCNRIAALKRMLLALNEQTLSLHAFEVVLVDDGSTQDPSTVVLGLGLAYRLMILKQMNHGPAAARNLGAGNASGEVLLFLDSDMIAVPGLLEQHLASHEVPNRLVVGPRSRYSASQDSRSLDRFDYRSDGTDPRLDKQPLTFQEAFTCNLSVRREDWHRLGGFDECFRSFEDVEFGFRAVKNGLKVYLNTKALAYHDHITNMRDRCLRAVSYTRMVPLLYQNHPELRGQINHLKDKEPISWGSDPVVLILRKLVRRLLACRLMLVSFEFLFAITSTRILHSKLVSFLYWTIVGSYQLIGLKEGIQQYGWN